VLAPAAGTVTALPADDATIAQGDVLYEVGGEPVIALYGDVPAYRSMRDLSDNMTGADVAQLEAALVALGYDPDGTVTVDDEFTDATEQMVERWQDSGIAFGSAADYSHGWLIPIASLMVVWMKRNEIADEPKSSSRIGLGIVILALMIHYVGAKAQQTRISLFALALLLWAIPFYLYGWKTARHLIFPCGFLIFCIPLNFLDDLSFKLRILMTIITTGSDRIIEQITKQLNKLVDVVKLQDITEGNYIEREMMFVKVKAEGDTQRGEVKRLSDIFRARIIDVTDTTFCIELTGSGDKLDAYIRAMHENNIVEVVRSGSMGILRGEKALTL